MQTCYNFMDSKSSKYKYKAINKFNWTFLWGKLHIYLIDKPYRTAYKYCCYMLLFERSIFGSFYFINQWNRLNFILFFVLNIFISLLHAKSTVNLLNQIKNDNETDICKHTYIFKLNTTEVVINLNLSLVKLLLLLYLF